MVVLPFTGIAASHIEANPFAVVMVWHQGMGQ
jgi:hypothetical protein